jgi:hypothetical protein
MRFLVWLYQFPPVRGDDERLVEKCAIVCEERDEDGSVVIRCIRALEKNCGYGTAAMKVLTAKADELHITLRLSAHPFGKPAKGEITRLANFYRRFGFVGRGGNTSYMTRKPSN